MSSVSEHTTFTTQKKEERKWTRTDLPVGLGSQDLPGKATRSDLDVKVEIDRKVVHLGGGIGKRIWILRVKKGD